MGNNNTRRSASYLWEMALRKLFPKRASSSKETTAHSSWSNLEPPGTNDHEDGFYKYSQELLEQERQKGRLRSSSSASYASALMAPNDLPSLPYTVSAPDWNIFSPYVKYLEEVIDHETMCEWLDSVLGVWSRVYTVSKVVVMAFLHYGVDLDDNPDGILAHIRRAEELVTSNSITDLVDSAENLYYGLYARLIMEIAAADLCGSFTLEFRRMPINGAFALPEPNQLCKILLVCKLILDDHTMCVNLNEALIREHQNEFIRYSMEKVERAGFFQDDLLGYRPHALRVIGNESSDFCQKWRNAPVAYQMPPAQILTLQSEKYLAFTPRSTVQQAVPALNLPFIDPSTVHPEIWEREIILDNRQATLAKLEGKCLGELRRQDDRRRLIDFVREKKCICRPVCSCAWDCTLDVERPCPCAERMLSLMIAKRRRSIGPLPFGPRCSALAKSIFQGLASIRSDANDDELSAEMDRAIIICAEEIRKQRAASATEGTIVI